MNREIKFRVWDNTNSRMEYRVTVNPESELVITNYGPLAYSEIELMQFTGLRDCNGKEIYEGDVVKVRHWTDDEREDFDLSVGEVRFSSGNFWITGGGYAINCHFHYNADDREVIGNVYENPELLN